MQSEGTVIEVVPRASVSVTVATYVAGGAGVPADVLPSHCRLCVPAASWTGSVEATGVPFGAEIASATDAGRDSANPTLRPADPVTSRGTERSVSVAS